VLLSYGMWNIAATRDGGTLRRRGGESLRSAPVLGASNSRTPERTKLFHGSTRTGPSTECAVLGRSNSRTPERTKLFHGSTRTGPSTECARPRAQQLPYTRTPKLFHGSTRTGLSTECAVLGAQQSPYCRCSRPFQTLPRSNAAAPRDRRTPTVLRVFSLRLAIALRAHVDLLHASEKPLPQPPYNPSVRDLVEGKRSGQSLSRRTPLTQGSEAGTRTVTSRIEMSQGCAICYVPAR